jgi:hypothetical protein
MKNIIVFETIEELLDAAINVRSHDDKSPNIPSTVALIIDDGKMWLSGEGSERFTLSESLALMVEELTKAALCRCGFGKVELK